MLFLKGFGALVLVLGLFTLFSFKAPKGDQAMSGLANAAVASFLVEAICKYILGDYLGISFFATIGEANGSLGAVASAILVGIAMGTDPIAAVAGGICLKSFGILPGFLAGYVMHWVLKPIYKFVPKGLNTILGALIAAAGSFGIAYLTNPTITKVIAIIGDSVTAATAASPIIMGLLLGGLMKIVCTSPLSSMALTAMLNLTGLPMGIACIACFGGTFTNGVIFKRLKLGTNAQVAAVMLEPLTQADIITKNPLPIYLSDFIGGGLSGITGAALQIACDAPGTASPIPGMLAPFAFNDPWKVLIALSISAVCGTLAGFLGSFVFKCLNHKGVHLYQSISNPIEAAAAD